MAKVVRCTDVGVDCDFEAGGETEQEVLNTCAEHGRTAHGVQELPSEPERTCGDPRGIRRKGCGCVGKRTQCRLLKRKALERESLSRVFLWAEGAQTGRLLLCLFGDYSVSALTSIFFGRAA